MFFDINELRFLGPVVDNYFNNPEGNYRDLLDSIIMEQVDPWNSLMEFFGYVMAPRNQIEESLKTFLDLPYNRMFNYLIPKKMEDNSSSEGPYHWQGILARWRLKLQK